MQFITENDFRSAAGDDSYYDPSRWDLYAEVIRILKNIPCQRILEIGPYKMPLVPNADTMDIRAELSPTIVHDAGEAPWPVADKSYDAVVALQVWEHLEGRQVEAFREVQRTARHAVLSFPYLWNNPSYPSHHNITDEIIEDWTDMQPPQDVILIATSPACKRIIYHFDFQKCSR